ncbi:acyl-CoA thioesterase [Phragmitibacter flavus]|uniref:Acyl-CoA thioesterase n=1 Tax=Phragmitibacter flavus TaxID=2576071 RepID=A0A5R8KGQ1_9BACT|nr:thioesterase family protein [Phragmitibacter flavus]TLD70779.1 acyl-CoA thioesterase [Phragmitibacter flavus]
MAHRFIYTDRVQFADTDMAGIMHFANFFRFVERAEHAFFRSVDLSIVERREDLPDEERVGWPRVHASCDYHAPLIFDDEVQVEIIIEEVRSKSLRYLFRVRKQDGSLCAQGHMAVVCVRKDRETRKMRAVDIPERIYSKIEAAPPEVLKRPLP